MTADRPFAPSPSVRRLRWTAAALCVIALHGAAVALMASRDAGDEGAGSMAIDLTPVAASVAVDVADRVPGPLMDEAASAASRAEKPAAHTPVAPSPLAADAELGLEPPTREAGEAKRAETGQRTESARSVQTAAVPLASAPPRLEAPPLHTAAVPATGLSAAAAKAQASWYTAVNARIARYQRYPRGARARHVEGRVTVNFTVDRAGRVLASRIAESSGSTLLDDEAIAMVRRAAPLPLPPPQAPGASFDLSLPVRFEMQ
jgi:protein TonB